MNKTTDPIADMINRIKNAQAVGAKTADVPLSNFKYNIAKLLAQKGFIEKFEKKGKRLIEITLKYDGKAPVISGVKRVSKPGQRIYANAREIKRVKGGYGIAIISTSKGLVTDKEAKKQKIGGEIVCEIW